MKSALSVAIVACTLLAVPREAWAQEPSPVRRHKSVGMMITGIVLTSLASATLVGGTALIAVAQSGSDGYGAGTLLGTLICIASVPFAAVGVPLWVVGARSPDSRAAQVPLDPQRPAWMTAVPAVGTGRKTATLTWSF